MLFLVRPVGCAISECVTQVEIDVLGNEELYDLGVSFACGNMQAGEAYLVFNFRVSTAVHKLLKSTDHVLLSSEMHRGVAADIDVILNVGLGFVLEQNFDNRVVLGSHGILQQSEVNSFYSNS